MIILVTNDDGFDAPGIIALIETLSVDAEVYLVAPDRERSASGHGITVNRPLRAREVHNYAGMLKGWAVDGTPADCVKLAIETLLPNKPDLIVSGINRGANLGNDVLYSGTVSAAIEAIMLGFPAMAISVADAEVNDYHTAALVARKIAKLIEQNGLPFDTLLNVNVPNIDYNLLKGYRICRLGKREYSNAIHRREDPRGNPYFWLAGEVVDTDNEEGTDTHAVKNNFVSVTPIHFDLTRYELIQEIKNWNFNE